MSSRINSDQSEYRGVLDALTLGSATATGDDALWPAVNRAVTTPLQMRAATPISRVISIDNITVTAPITGRKKTIAPIGGLVIPNVTSFTLTADSTGAGNLTPSSGSALALGMTASQFLKIGVHLLSSGALSLTKGSASSTLVGASLPAVPSGSYPIGYIYVATDASNNIANIDETNITQYAGGGSGGGGLTTSPQSASFTAAAGNHYLVNSTSGAVAVQMPAGSAGSVLRFTDSAKTVDVNAVTFTPASGERFAGKIANATITLNKRGFSTQFMWDSVGSFWAVDLANYTPDFDTLVRDAYFYDNFEQDTSGVIPNGWARYDDGAVTIPVDGTGGSPNADFTFFANTTTPLVGGQSAVLTKTANNRQGHGISRAFTVPSGWSIARKNEFTFMLDTTSANYVAGYAVVYIYDITNNTLITPSNTSLPQGFKGQWTVSWDSSTSSSYRVIIHTATATTTAWTVKVDNVMTGPGSVTQGAAVGPWQSYTPTFTGSGSNPSGSTVTGAYRQVGDSLEIVISVISGASAAWGSGQYYFSFPTGFTPNTGVLANQNGGYYQIEGSALAQVTAAANQYQGTLAYNPALQTTGMIIRATGGSAGQLWGNAVPASWTNSVAGQTITIGAVIPMSQLTGSGTVNLGAGAQVEYVYNTDVTDTDTTASGFAFGQAGGAFTNNSAQRTKRVQWQTPIQSNSLIELQYSSDGGNTWLAQNTTIVSYYGQGSTTYGWALQYVSATQTDVLFAQYRASNNATFGGAGATFTSLAASPTVNRWRVMKANPSAPVGFGMAGTDGSSGLVQAGKLPGLTTGAAVAAGYVGETSSDSSATFFTTTATSIITKVLQPGKWRLDAFTNFNTASSSTSAQLSISLVNNTVDTSTNAFSSITVGSGLGSSATSLIVNISTPTTYYVVGIAGTANMSNLQNTRLLCQRIG